MDQPKRIAIGTIFTECNELGGIPIERSWFERYDLLFGHEMLTVDSGVLGGMLNVLREESAEILPLLFAQTCPGGPLTADCYVELKQELLERLANVLPVDGVLLPLHGAAAAEGTGDLEGDLIEGVRLLVGREVPIVATLDLHAHITPQMVTHADALVAWETYPHADALTTGMRGARLLIDTLAGHCHPTMAVAKVPVITSAIHASTHEDDPFAHLMMQAKALEDEPDVLSTSMILVQPYLDQPDMGSGAVVVTDNNVEKAKSLATELANAYWARRHELEPRVWAPEDAIARGLGLSGDPVALIETADCCGGGAAGDSVATLRALLAANLEEPAYVPVIDPEAALTCHSAQVGTSVSLQLGHKLDGRWGKPLSLTVIVQQLHHGQFTYQGGIYDGVVGEMGPTALVSSGSIQILIMSHGTYDWRDEQMQTLGLHPEQFKFVVAKNPMNYRMIFDQVAAGIFILDTPGPTPPSIRRAQFKRLKRPFFPVDDPIEPVVSCLT
ncbi:MAG: M81 family metallopeptidase [Chloroflexota bacterium]